MNVVEGVPEIVADADEWMSQYLDDQTNIAGYSHATQNLSTNEDRDRIRFSDFASVDGSGKYGSSTVLTAGGRVDCGMPEGCGTEGPPIRF